MLNIIKNEKFQKQILHARIITYCFAVFCFNLNCIYLHSNMPVNVWKMNRYSFFPQINFAIFPHLFNCFSCELCLHILLSWKAPSSCLIESLNWINWIAERYFHFFQITYLRGCKSETKCIADLKVKGKAEIPGLVKCFLICVSQFKIRSIL